MAHDDGDLVSLLFFGAAGYLLWKNWDKIAPMFNRTSSSTVTTTSTSGGSSWVNPPVQYAPSGQSGQLFGTPKPSNSTFQSLGMPAMQGSIFTNPNWKPQLQPDMIAPTAPPVNRPPNEVVSTLPGEWTAGRPALERSDPNAPPDVDAAWWAEHEKYGYCYAITGAKRYPVLPGCEGRPELG